MPQDLIQRIENRSAAISIFGLGYVGLPLATMFVRAGFEVVGYDINPQYVTNIRTGNSSVLDVPDGELRECLATGRFQVTAEPNDLRRAHIHIICVPTPLSKSRQPDMSCIESALATLLEIWTPGRMAILESTTYPGTTDEVLLPALAKNGLQIDRDFLLAFSPERVDPGNVQFPLHTIPKVVGGVTKSSTEAASALYSTVFDTIHPVSQARTAELAKLLENTFRNVNIALVNEFSQICDTINVDVWETITAANTKPFGFMPFYPGPGIGGHCIPLDPQYLVYKARLHGYEPRLVALADQINTERPRYIVQQAMEQLNEKGTALRGARILVMGVAYKPDVPDLRESPALPILEMLLEKGADVAFCDPWVGRLRLENGHEMTAVELSAAQIAQADLVLIITPHQAFDYDLLRGSESRTFDTRNVLASKLGASRNEACAVR